MPDTPHIHSLYRFHVSLGIDALCPFFVHLANTRCCVMLLHQVLYVLCYAGIFDFILKSIYRL